MVIPPMDESLDKSFKSDTPLINEANINGTAISFKELIKIVYQFGIKVECNIFDTKISHYSIDYKGFPPFKI